MSGEYSRVCESTCVCKYVCAWPFCPCHAALVYYVIMLEFSAGSLFFFVFHFFVLCSIPDIFVCWPTARFVLLPVLFIFFKAPTPALTLAYCEPWLLLLLLLSVCLTCKLRGSGAAVADDDNDDIVTNYIVANVVCVLVALARTVTSCDLWHFWNTPMTRTALVLQLKTW